MKAVLALSTLACASAFAPSQSGSKASTATSATKADLQEIAKKSNPTLGFYDPLNLADASFWGLNNEATIGFLRHSEIKHGRIAMFAFVGYIVQSNFVFPWPQTLAGDAHPSIDLSPEAQWDGKFEGGSRLHHGMCFADLAFSFSLRSRPLGRQVANLCRHLRSRTLGRVR